MVRIVIVSHGGLAAALLDSAEMILGTQPGVKAIGLFPGDSPESFQEKIRQALEEFGGEEILLFSDIRSGTPFNAAGTLMQTYRFRHISGVTLGMLLEALSQREGTGADALGDEIMGIAAATILDVNTLLE